MLTKTLCKNLDEVVKNFVDSKLSYEEISYLVGIDFAFEDGTYLSDGHHSEEDSEEYKAWYEQECDDSKFRVNDEDSLPESYPVLVLHEIEDTFDRTGPVKIRIIEYVYLSDFEVK